MQPEVYSQSFSLSVQRWWLLRPLPRLRGLEQPRLGRGSALPAVSERSLLLQMPKMRRYRRMYKLISETDTRCDVRYEQQRFLGVWALVCTVGLRAKCMQGDSKGEFEIDPLIGVSESHLAAVMSPFDAAPRHPFLFSLGYTEWPPPRYPVSPPAKTR